MYQKELLDRISFLWRKKFEVEKQEVETMGALNKVLLHNILPEHVAQMYLNGNLGEQVCFHKILTGGIFISLKC